ncbi:MAG TPA: ribbon-helix-helix protein, CopG family [Acidimicrobiales bacterium]|nr:ribbon-helix-helix protein, CopG family [Acidimicrobiales bacterium]
MPRKIESEKRFITLYLDNGVVERIDRLAAAQDASRAKYLERLIIEHLDEDEATVQAFTNPVLLNALMQVFGQPDVARQLVQTMRRDVSDDQLQLFQEAMMTTAEKMNKRAARKPMKRVRSKPKKKKGGGG